MSIIKPHIAAMSAYSPPLEGRNPDQFLPLDFNERTVPISEPVKHALMDFINGNRLQMYPSYGSVVDDIAGYANVLPEQVMITNGSDQGIDLIFRAVCSAGDEAIIPAPNFAMYKQCAGIENLRVIEPHYQKERGFPLPEVLAAISEKTRIICISNPCNPSGTAVDIETIVAVAKAAPQAAVLVDECYFEYSKISAADKVTQFPNIVITRTFSKTWGFPSLRMGYIIADASVIRSLLNVRGPYDINQLAVVAVQAALKNPEYTFNYVDEVMAQAKPQLERFLDDHGVDYWPSSGNYVWAFFDNAKAVAAKLQSVNILVRPKANAQGELGLRITVGTLEQTDRLIVELRKIVGDLNAS